MIDLTPLDVRKKRDDFKRAVRGYDSAQVDAFLEVVADRLEQLVREHGSLTDQAAHMQRQLDTYQERERALNEALLAAQELREEARSQSERDAAVRLREAETHAEAILLDADQAIRHSQRRMEDLRARRRHYLKSLRSLMERFEDYLELEETRLESEPEDLGDLLERLDRDLVPDASDIRIVDDRVRGTMGSAGTPSLAADDLPDDMSGEDADSMGPRAMSEELPVNAQNGQPGRTISRAADAAGESDSGSHLATPAPITPADPGETGMSAT
jgi:cell division initiation protein